MEPISIAAIVFLLMTMVPFIAFLWYGCDVRSIGHEAREEARRLAEIEESYKGRHFSNPETVSHISAIRDEPASGTYKPSMLEPRIQHAAEIREAIAAKSYFRRRKKALPSEPHA